MPTEVYEEPLDLQIFAVESVPLEAQGGVDHQRAYPHTLLKPTEELRELSTMAIVLDNEFLRVAILPEIGGRIYSIFDKRIGKEVLPKRQLLKAETMPSPRGAYLPDGIQFDIGTHPFALSMADVNHQIQEGPISGVWLGSSTGAVGFHAFVGVPNDKAQILIEIRSFNRTLEWQTAGVRLWAHLGETEVTQRNGSTWFYSAKEDAGLCVAADLTALQNRTLDLPVPVALNRFHSPIDHFGPRQLDTWSVVLAPFGGIGKPDLVTVEGAIAIGKTLSVQSTSHRPAHKLFLLTEDQQTFEAPAAIDGAKPLVIDLANLPARPTTVVLATAEKEEVLRYDPDAFYMPLPDEVEVPERPRSWRTTQYFEACLDIHCGEDPRPRLRQANFDPAIKAACHTVEGLYHLSRKEYSSAAEAFEDSLGHNAEDHLTWWYKAIAHRLAGDADEERPELLNAHYLAPLEPALRVESFLQMDQSLGKEPSTILAPLAEHPEQFIDVASLLLEAKLYSEAVRLLDEALRHIDMPMLRYLLAHCYLSGSRMEVEAADQVKRASAKPIGAPYPWRPAEIQALETLSKRFPDDPRLTEWLELVGMLHLNARAGH